jgi:ferredoxin
MTKVHGLRLLAGGQELAAPASQTLLQTVLKAGLSWPSSCRNGTCRVCIGQMERGTVRYRVEWPGLLPEERAGGAVLPCVACPTSDVVLGPPAD